MKANSRERQVGNCWQAYKRVKTNKGSPGIDGIEVGDLSGYLKQHWPTMKELAAYLQGWKSYFGFCQTPSLLKALDHFCLSGCFSKNKYLGRHRSQHHNGWWRPETTG